MCAENNTTSKNGTFRLFAEKIFQFDVRSLNFQLIKQNVISIYFVT